MRYALLGMLVLVLCSNATADDLADLKAEVAKLKKENEELRTSIVEIEKDRNDKLQRVVALTDTVNQTAGELARMEERIEREFQRLREFFKPRLLPLPPLEGARKDAEPIDGVVVAVATEPMRIELSIGADDGLKLGTKLAIKRDGKQIGTAKINKVTANRSVCDVIGKPDRPIRKGDHVDLRIEDEERLEKLRDHLEGK